MSGSPRLRLGPAHASGNALDDYAKSDVSWPISDIWNTPVPDNFRCWPTRQIMLREQSIALHLKIGAAAPRFTDGGFGRLRCPSYGRSNT